MSLPEPVLAILPQVAGAAVAVALGLACGRRRADGSGGGPAPAWTAALPLAAGAAVAAFLIAGWRGFPPSDVNSWPILLALPVAALALAAGAAWRWFVPAALAYTAIALPLLLRVSLRDWSAGQAALWLPALGLPWFGLILATRAAAERLPSAALAAWAGTLAVAGYVIADPGGGAFCGLLCAGAGAAAGLVAFACPRWGGRLAPGVAAVAIAATAPMWWLLAHSLDAYADNRQIIPALALAPFALAPLAAWAAWPLRARPWLAGIAAAVIAGLVAAAALLLLSPPPAPDPSGW